MLAISNQKNEHRALVAEKPKATGSPLRDSAQLNPVWQSLALIHGGLRAKLAVSQPDDPYEREADRIADRVMNAPAPQSKDAGISVSANVPQRAQRKCGPCLEGEETEGRVNR